MKRLSVLLVNHSWFAEELRELGHEVLTLGLGTAHLMVSLPGSLATAADMMQALPPGFTPDRIVWFDDSGVPWLLGLEDLNIPKVFLSVDSHHHLEWHRRFAKFFDAVLVAQKDHLPGFETVCKTVNWFPPWATRFLEPCKSRDLEVVFRGTLDEKLHPKRTAFFSELRSLVPIDAARGDYATCYPRAKIVVNEAVENDLNFRVFEAMSAGALLITPDNQMGLCDLFEAGSDLVTYRAHDARDAAERVRYYLSNEHERAEIAKRGFEKVMTKHTSLARARMLNEVLADLLPIAVTVTERYLDAAFLSVFSRIVRQDVGLFDGESVLLHHALSALQHFVESALGDDCERALGLLLQVYEDCHRPQHGELFSAVVARIVQKSPNNQLARILLAGVSERLGHTASVEEQARALGSNRQTLLSHLPKLLLAAREDYSIVR